MTESSEAGPAPAAGPALARCIAVSAGEFAERHWGRAPLLTRAGTLPQDFTDLLDRRAVDELVSARGLRTPFLRMAKDGAVLPGSTFTRSGGAGAGIADQVADDRVLAQLADGATLVLQALHRTWPPLIGFGAQLADELGHPIQINAYITPPQSRGFASHYDVHDVFVLQVCGRKRWRIHQPAVVDPLEDTPWERTRPEVTARAEGEPLLECVLEPGDSLYLPRGTIHAAEALGETSIHLTVGVHPITRFHLVRALLEMAASEPALRTSLPMGVDLSDPAVLQPHVSTTAELLRARLATAASDAVDTVAARVGDRLADQTRPEPIGPLASLDAAAELTTGSRLRLRRALPVRVADGTDSITLRLPDRTMSLPAAAAEAVKTVLTGEPFTVAELPGLAEDDRLAVARRLLRAGVVVPLDAG